MKTFFEKAALLLSRKLRPQFLLKSSVKKCCEALLTDKKDIVNLKISIGKTPLLGIFQHVLLILKTNWCLIHFK